MSFVPLPWWTSQSRIRTRSAPQRSSAWRAATATLLNRQKPIARSSSAWWPGGRCSDAPKRGPSPPEQRVDDRHRAARRVQRRRGRSPRETTVSASSAPPPAALTLLDAAHVLGRDGRPRATSRSAAGDSRTSQPSQSRSLERALDRDDPRRRARDAVPVSCSSDDGWRSRSGAAISLPYPRMAGPARIETDLVVVGAGAAGLYAALTAAPQPARASRSSPRRRWPAPRATGRRAASRPRWRPTTRPTCTARTPSAPGATSCARARPPSCAARRRARSRDLERLGVHFDADRHGNLALGLEGGHSRRRVVHAGGSATGRRVVRQLSARRRRDARRRPSSRAPAPRRCGSATARCVGVVCEDGRAIHARAVILATGGSAALWQRTTNPPGSLGIGLLLARGAGAALADLELMQFHPTAVTGDQGPRGLPGHRGDPRRGRHAARRRRRALRRGARAARRGGARDLVEDGRERAAERRPRHARGRPGAVPERRRRAARGRPRPGDRARAGGARRALRHGRHRGRPRRRDDGARASTPSARAPAPGCTAPTGWPPTRSASASSSARAPRSRRSPSRAARRASRRRAPDARAAQPRDPRRAVAPRRPRARRRGPDGAGRRPAPARAPHRPPRAAARREPRRPHALGLPGRPRPRLDLHHSVTRGDADEPVFERWV